jgi:exonuclease VII small subunit
MTDQATTNGELNERIARLEARLTAFAEAQALIAHAIDLRFRGAEKQVETALASAEKAVSKAEVASEKRFEGVNEFRQSLNDSQRLNMPRLEVEGLVRAANEKTDAIYKSLSDKIEQSASAQDSRLDQVNKVLSDKVDRFGAEMSSLSALVTGLNLRRQGADEGKQAGYGWVAAMVMAAMALAGFITTWMSRITQK